VTIPHQLRADPTSRLAMYLPEAEQALYYEQIRVMKAAAERGDRAGVEAAEIRRTLARAVPERAAQLRYPAA
jgi:hypothetical protein